MAWSVTIDGTALNDETLMLAELVDIEARTGVTWGDLNPAASAFQAFSILCVLYETRKRLTMDEAATTVGRMTAAEAIDHFAGEIATPLTAA